MPEVKLMTPLFDGGMYNRTGRRMRAVFIKEVADGNHDLSAVAQGRKA